MNILITGGSGFIGSHLAKELLAQGHDIRILDRKAPEDEELKEYYRFGLITDNHHVLIRNFKPDVVYHLAAQTDVQTSMKHPYEDADTNIRGTYSLLHTLESAEFKGKFIFASSAAVYGNPQAVPISEDTQHDPDSPYGMSKSVGEFYVGLSPLNTTTLRFSNVYGKGSHGVISTFLSKLDNGERITVYGGNQTRDYIYVKDLVSALIKCIESPRKSVYNVSTGKETSLGEVIEILELLRGSVIYAKKAPLPKGEILRSSLDNQKLGLALNWYPSYTLETGLYDLLKQ